MTQPIVKQIADLRGKSQDELKALWREYFGTEPPAYRRGFLIRGLAHRIQELTLGGLPADYQRRLDALVEERPEGGKRKRLPKCGQTDGGLLPGTTLVREWQGVAHHVTVRADGFEHQGRLFKSLSAVAREIAGTRWNGWAFFGLPNPAKRERRAA